MSRSISKWHFSLRHILASLSNWLKKCEELTLSVLNYTSVWHIVGVPQTQVQLQFTILGWRSVKGSSSKARIAIYNFAMSRGLVAEVK